MIIIITTINCTNDRILKISVYEHVSSVSSNVTNFNSLIMMPASNSFIHTLVVKYINQRKEIVSSMITTIERPFHPIALQ